MEPRGEEEEAEERRELTRQEERGELEEESSPVPTSQQTYGIADTQGEERENGRRNSPLSTPPWPSELRLRGGRSLGRFVP